MDKPKYTGQVYDVLKSRKFQTFVTGILVTVAIHMMPALEPHAADLTRLVLLLAGLIIGLFGAEDVIGAISKALVRDMPEIIEVAEDIFEDIRQKNETNDDRPEVMAQPAQKKAS